MRAPSRTASRTSPTMRTATRPRRRRTIMLTFLLTTTTSRRRASASESARGGQQVWRQACELCLARRTVRRLAVVAQSGRHRLSSRRPQADVTPSRSPSAGSGRSCWDDVGRRRVSRQASGQSQGPGATGVRMGSPSSLEAVSDVRASTQSKLRSRWRTGGRSRAEVTVGVSARLLTVFVCGGRIRLRDLCCVDSP